MVEILAIMFVYLFLILACIVLPFAWVLKNIRGLRPQNSKTPDLCMDYSEYLNIQAELILGTNRAFAPVLEIFEHTSPSLAITQSLQVAFLEILSNWSYEEVQTFFWSD